MGVGVNVQVEIEQQVYKRCELLDYLLFANATHSEDIKAIFRHNLRTSSGQLLQVLTHLDNTPGKGGIDLCLLLTDRLA
jgi:hypothetical protein